MNPNSGPPCTFPKGNDEGLSRIQRVERPNFGCAGDRSGYGSPRIHRACAPPKQSLPSSLQTTAPAIMPSALIEQRLSTLTAKTITIPPPFPLSPSVTPAHVLVSKAE